MHNGWPKMIDAHTTRLPQRDPNRTCMNREKRDNGICPIIPINAQILNVFSGTLTYFIDRLGREKNKMLSVNWFAEKWLYIMIDYNYSLTKYSWKNALTKNTINDAADRL